MAKKISAVICPTIRKVAAICGPLNFFFMRGFLSKIYLYCRLSSHKKWTSFSGAGQFPLLAGAKPTKKLQ